jgi:hypothetical protein
MMESAAALANSRQANSDCGIPVDATINQSHISNSGKLALLDRISYEHMHLKN